MILKSKKEFQDFLKNIECNIISLESKININKKELRLTYSLECIQKVEEYFQNVKEMSPIDIIEFWTYFGEALKHYVGGKYT